MPRAESIRFRGQGGDEIGGLLVRAEPELAGVRGPAIVLVQEVFGLDPHIRAMAERFAAEGFTVLAPDLYSREGVPGPVATDADPAPAWTAEQIRAAVASLPDRRVLGDLEGALAHLAADPAVDPKRLGTVGFCMGGNYAFLAGCASRRVACVVDFYGRFVYRELGPNKPIQPLELALNLSGPLLLIFGEDDASISMDDVERFRDVLARFAKDVTIATFPGVGHGFMNDRRKSHDPAAAAKAFGLAVDFLREHLLVS